MHLDHVRHPWKYSSYVGWIGLALLFGSGCAPILDSVKMEDKGTPTYIGTVLIAPESMRYGSGRAGRGAIEITYQRFLGEDIQQIDADHYVQFGANGIYGPDSLTNTVELKHAHVAYNHRFEFGSHFEFEPAVGLALDKLDARVQSLNASSRIISKSDTAWGVAVRVTPRWMFNRHLGSEAQLGFGIDQDGMWNAGSTFSAVFRPSKHVDLKLGYYDFEQSFDFSKGTSDIETSFSGIAGQVTVTF